MDGRRTHVDRTEAARMLGVNRTQLSKLIETHTLLVNDDGKPLRAEVESLVQLAHREVPDVDGPVLLCPLSANRGDLPESAGSLFLDPALEFDRSVLTVLNRNLSVAGQPRTHGFIPSGRYQGSGPWQVREGRALHLAESEGLIAGVVAGFVREIARVRSYAGFVPYRRGRLFVIEPLSRQDEHQWLGVRVGALTQIPRFL